MRFHIVTLFPDFFSSPLACGLMDKAIRSGLLEVHLMDPRNYTEDRHRHVDDAPYGGGPGMVMQVEPLVRCLRDISTPGTMLCMTPRGPRADQKLMQQLAQEEDVTIVCGRYEGFDERLFTTFPNLMPLAIGDLVLNGGESAALAIMEAIARLVPGFMGKEASAEEESFAGSLLEYPQYTRPPVFEGQAVPEVLLGGNHAEIAAWRRRQALVDTRKFRPDLLEKAVLDREDVKTLKEVRVSETRVSEASVSVICAQGGRGQGAPGIHLLLAGTMQPARARHAKKVHGSLGGLAAAHDLLCSLKREFDLSCIFFSGALAAGLDGDTLALLEREGVFVLSRGHDTGSRDTGSRDAGIQAADIRAAARAIAGQGAREKPLVVGVAPFPKKGGTMPFQDVRRALSTRPVLLVAGVDGFLEKDVLQECDWILRPVRPLSDRLLGAGEYLAIVFDRILGDL